MSATATAAGRVLTGAVLGFLVLAAPTAAVESPAAPSGGIGAASQPTRALTVFVTDERTGKPLADVNVESSWLTVSAAAQIRAQPRSGQPGCDAFPRVLVEARTNADGQATLQIPAEDLENGSVLMTRTGYAAARASWGVVFGKKSPINPTRVEAALIPAVAIGGIVKNEEAVPVAGVTLQINRSLHQQRDTPKDGETSYRIFAEVTTDEQGRWEFDGMADRKPRHLELQLNINHPDYTKEFDASHESNPPWDQLLAKSWVFTIKKDRRPRATLTGRVVDSAGKPIEGAKVWTGEYNYGVGLTGDSQLRTKSNVEGRFFLADITPLEPSITGDGAPKPTYEIINIAAAGYHWKQVEWDVLQGSREETFQLTPAPPLRVQVVDPAGSPIADVDMGYPRATQSSVMSYVGKTDAEGVFVFTDYPEGGFTVDVRKDGRQSRKLSRDDLAAGKVVLGTEPRIVGIVLDAATGKPIERFRFGLQRERADLGGSSLPPRLESEGQNGRFELSDRSSATHYQVMVEADGYASYASEKFTAEQMVGQELRIELKPAPIAVRKILTPDGAPATGAICTVMSARRDQHQLQGFKDGKAKRELHRGPWGEEIEFIESIADADGNAKVRWKKEKDSAYVYHATGWSFLEDRTLRSDEAIPLQLWSRVTGVLREGGKPVVGAEVVLRSSAKRNALVSFVAASQEYRAITDSEGRFAIDQVLPGYGRIGPAAPAEFQWWQPRFERSVEIEIGKTAEVAVVAEGARVVARLPVRGEPARTMEGNPLRPSISMRRMPKPAPPEVREQGSDAIYAWYEQWKATEEGRRVLELPHEYMAEIAEDCAIRFAHVAPGDYSLDCMLWADGATHNFSAKVTVPETAKPGETIDLGLLEPKKPELALKPGMPAPDLTAKTADGADFQLSTLRGKFIVIDFWATWCGPCRAAMPELKQIHAEFAKDERVAFLGLSFDDSLSDWKRYIKEESLPGTQLISKGFAENPLSKAWGVRGIPAVFVIDPAGRILAANTTPAGAESALRAALPKTSAR
ncbi:MAG: redoxin domain-containing protein [Phycisphaerae bacterium]|nr:redoxin domain-containing protein [Phycisphaerae bacterium]